MTPTTTHESFINRGESQEAKAGRWERFLSFIGEADADVLSCAKNRKDELFEISDRLPWIFCWMHKGVSLTGNPIFIQTFRTFERFMILHEWGDMAEGYINGCVKLFSEAGGGERRGGGDDKPKHTRSVCTHCRRGAACMAQGDHGECVFTKRNCCDVNCDIHLCATHGFRFIKWKKGVFPPDLELEDGRVVTASMFRLRNKTIFPINSRRRKIKKIDNNTTTTTTVS